ncbi:serine-rich coiled-coil domain-containing protein 2 isoform X2 [Anguilla anguilla]|uniref:serine-rich coiled-coil domain-containing protein 2 isoform X2 n=1 Tax=Anguilla anguilla TaxID=7936 RepID=UPI0015AF2291|nr:serine-rich coiled-coil domain-containing protein 2 isoform X2 [Anguilla anguilla]
MDEKAFTKSTMVSRLPKFGARPQGGAIAVANEPVQSGPAPEGKSAPQGGQNGILRLPSFSMRWRKENGGLAAPPAHDEQAGLGNDGSAPHCQRQQLPTTREIKKPSAPTIKAGRFASSTTPASSKPVSQIPKVSPPRVGLKPGPNPPSGSSKPALNGLGGGGAGAGAGGGAGGRFGSGLPRPRAGSGSTPTPSSSRDSLSRSQDSLKTLPLDNMVRSQSLTLVRQLPSPTGLPIPRSFSFNRAVELAKPLADTQLRTKTPVLKHPLLPGAGRPGVAPGCSTPPTPIKKLLMPNCVLSKPSLLGYRLSRPTLAKLPRPLAPGQPPGGPKVGQGGGDSSVVSPIRSDPLGISERVQGDLGPVAMVTGPAPLRCLGEGLEDMSLSSASSLDRNDTSEDFLDDFDNLGDGMLLLSAHNGEEPSRPHPQGDDIVPDNRRQGTPTQMPLDEFLPDDVDWVGISLSGCRDDPGPLALSPEVDFPHGSSLELSPSNSSGGTYMWDEEGLEPLCCTHPCGSYDSDINSTDILDHLKSCDLEDDDLMLDVDLTEDVSLQSDPDGMSHFENSERGGRQGHWRRRQHRWSGPDHFHNDNRRALLQLGRVGPAARPDGHMGALDQVTLRLMAQDCTSVKSQLLKLKSLLQLEDVGVGQEELLSGVPSPESSEGTNTSLQVEELTREVQELREELKRKDKAIAQLTQQASVPVHAVRCQCQQRAPVSRGERRLHHDKATQTPWRGHAPQILQPAKHCPSDPHTPQRLASSAPSEDRCEPASIARDNTPPRGRPRPQPRPDASPAGRAEAENLLQGPHLKTGETGGPPGASGARLSLAAARSISAERGSPSRVPWTPRLHRRAPLRAPPPEGAGVTRGRSEGRGEEPKTLPPPSRGLPCFSPSLPRARFGQVPSQTHPEGSRESQCCLPNTRGLVTPSHLRLPTPKIP